MDGSNNSWLFRGGRPPKDALRVVNYFRWFWIRIRYSMDGSWSQYVSFLTRSLILCVSSNMDDVVMKIGLPVESYANQDNQQAY